MLPILLIALLSLVAQLVLPWWSLALVTFAFCYGRSATSRQAFWQSFAGVALVWLVYATFIHVKTDGILTGRMAQLIAKTDASAVMLILAPVVAGLAGGLAGWAGHLTRQLVAQSGRQRRSA